jgi:hypothetical protein
MKMTRNPHIREIVLTPPVVLNPWKRIAEAMMVAVVKKT